MDITNTTQETLRNPNKHDPNANHTVTFIIGFSILLIFLLVGILASTFLCYILKKDVYLWEAEQRKLDEENQITEDDFKTDEETKSGRGEKNTENVDNVE